MQILTLIQIFAAFIIDLPVVLDNWQEPKAKRILKIMGIFGVYDYSELRLPTRAHYVLACFAVFLTEVWIVANQLFLKAQTQ